MADYLVTDTELTSIADAIRTKGGTSADLSFPTGFVSAINAISTGASNVFTGTLTVNVKTTSSVTITTGAELGLTKSEVEKAKGFFIWANQNSTQKNDMLGAVFMNFGTATYKLGLRRGTTAYSFSPTNSNTNWVSGGTSLVCYNSQNDVITWSGTSTYPIPAGTYDWVLVL